MIQPVRLALIITAIWLNTNVIKVVIRIIKESVLNVKLVVWTVIGKNVLFALNNFTFMMDYVLNAIINVLNALSVNIASILI